MVLTQKNMTTTNNGTDGPMQIEGVPEGFEPVAFGRVVKGEVYMCPIAAHACEWVASTGSDNSYLKVRRVEPVCTWQHGVFADGWIAEDNDGDVFWHDELPSTSTSGYWESGDDDTLGLDVFFRLYSNPPVFRSDLPWTSRIQQVGPTIESTLKVMT